MIGWLILAVYLLGAIFTAWYFGGVVAWDMNFSGTLSGDDVAMGIVMGLMLGAIWPLTLPVAAIAAMTKKRGATPFLYTPPEQRAKLAAKRELLLQARIAELERQVGVK